MNFFRAAFILFIKDVRLEFRTKEMINTLLVFALLTVVIFNFAFPPGIIDPGLIASGIFWVTIIFTGTLAFNRSFTIETEEDSLRGLLLMPYDPTFILLGKSLFNFLLITIIEIVVYPIITVLFRVSPVGSYWIFILTVILATLGLTFIGTLQGAVLLRTRAREILLPLLFFPIIVPLIIAATKATEAFLTGKIDPWSWLKFLALFDFIYISATVFLFEYTLED